jgi:hypothetical protein
VIFAHDRLFAGKPELFNGGAILWDWLYRLCFAFVASFIFYVVVIHVRRQRDKEDVRPFIRAKTGRICEQAKKLIGGLRGKNVMKYDRHYYPSYEETKTLCKHIRAHDPSPRLVKGRRVPWHEFMTHLMDSTKQEIASIYAVSHLLDTDYLKLLMDIEECGHFAFLEMSGYALEPDLSFFAAGQIYDYIEKVRALEQYSE